MIWIRNFHVFLYVFLSCEYNRNITVRKDDSMHYMNEEHQKNVESLSQIFPTEDKTRTAVLYVFAVPSLYQAFQKEFEDVKHESPISISFAFLDNEMPHISLSTGEEMLVKLAIMLYSGETDVKKGGFNLYKAFQRWDDEYMKVFQEAISIVRPVLQR